MMKKKQIFLKTIVAITLLSAMLVSLLLGMTNAEYLKSLSKKFDIELKPDLMLEYYLLDADTTTSAYANYNPERGKYKNAESFQQKIIIGNVTSVELQNTTGSTTKSKIYLGDDVIYQIKIPVSETGYYTLNFTSEFLFADADEPTYRDTNKFVEEDFFTISHQYAVGCEIINSENRGSTVVFPTSKPAASSGLDMESRVFANNEYYKMPYYVADSAFQWKTLCPSRAENVKLSFKVTEEDVTNGYVVWAWELTGLKGGREYNFICKSLSAEKIMDLEGVSSSKPYFMLPSTRVTNNQVKIYGQVHPDDTNEDTVPGNSPVDNGMDGTGYYERRGSSTPGITDYSAGRGTYVTEATSNSLGLRAETLGSGVLVDSTQNWYFDNPVSFMVPIKNVKYNTTYKVTFDMSVARQGTAGPNKSITSYNIRNDKESIVRYERNGDKVTSKTGETAKNWWDYAEFQNIFNRPDTDALYHSDYSAPDNSDSNTVFYSYFHANTSAIDSTTEEQNVDYKSNNKTYSKSFTASRLSTHDLKSGLTSGITYANKGYQNEPLVKYDEVLNFYNFCNDTSKRNYPDLTTSTSVNDTYSIDYFNNNSNADSTSMRNFFNAIQHTEINGQNAIRWITFYNTTFSFNIPESSNGSVNLDELYWVWAIHALEYESFYNIRIDNLRIEEVVEYTSCIAHNGVTIGGSQIGTAHMDSRGVGTGGEDSSVFNNYKGWNSTGQNFQARFHDPNKYMVNGNIYAPIIDAKKLPAAPGGGNGPNDYKIALSGWAVLKGGVQKYVWSADGGVTWHDMTFDGSSDTSVISEAQKGINQTTKQQTDDVAGGYIYNVFTNEDAVNNNFSNGTLIADISPYKHQADIDIIIAAVPEANNNFRCEILKIMNYNSANFYVSSLTKVKSDITVGSTSAALEYDSDDFTISSATTGNSDIYNSGSCYAKYYPTFGRGVFTNQTAMSSRIDYTKLQTTCSNIPVKKELNIIGGIVCNRGVYSYEFSVDGGKTWTPIKHRNAYYTDGTNAFYKDSEGKYRYKSDDTVYNGDKDSITYASKFDLTYGDGATETYEKLLYKFITRSTANDHAYFAGANGDFDEGGTRLFIDLSAYEGQIVDVIVAAKPNFQYAGINNITDAKTDIYLPVAKIDNVAVYGENGTFYSRIHTVYVDRDSSEANRRKIIPLNEDPNDKSYLNCSDNFAITNEGGAAEIGSGFAYTIFEVNNVNPRHMRFYNNSFNEMMSGGKISIDGYVMCHGGVKQYKFSLDGGEQWTVINDAGIDITSSAGAMYANSKKSDSTFALPDDGIKGNFCCTGPGYASTPTDFSDSSAYFQHALEFNLPALPAGSERNLLVVAEGNIDSDGDGEGNLYPVLAMKLKFKYKDGESSQYGYYRDRDLSSSTSGTGVEKSGWVSENQSWIDYPLIGSVTNSKDNNSFNRMTIPVTEAGEFNLNLTHNIKNKDNKPISNRINGVELHKKSTSNANDANGVLAKTSSGGIARAAGQLDIEKTHFMQGEDIPIKWTVRSGQNFVSGAIKNVTIAIVSAEWENEYGNRFALWHYTIPNASLPQEADISKSGSISDLKSAATHNFNAGLPQHLSSLPAGKYSIFLVNQGVNLAWADVNSTTGNVKVKNSNGDTVKLASRWLLARIDNIYIHSPDEVVDYTVLHDSGSETCFSDVNQFFDNSSTDSRIAGRYRVENPFTTKNISIPVTVTPEDVKRGYIVLDIKFSKFLYQSITAPGEVEETIDGVTKTVIHVSDQTHIKLPFSATENGDFEITLGTTPLVKRTS